MILSLDEQGFIKNEGRKKNIPKKLRPAIDEVIKFSNKKLGNNLLSIYIRGSVAAGRFINYVSDVDIIVIFNKRLPTTILKDFQVFSQRLNSRYKFVNGFDIFIVSLKDLLESRELNKLRVYLKTQSVCLKGEDTVAQWNKFKPDRSLSKYLLSNIDSEFTFIEMALSGSAKANYNKQRRDINFWRVWMSRTVLRFSLYASLPKHGLYTNDLLDCHQIVSSLYPELTSDLDRAISLSQSPSKSEEDPLIYFKRMEKNIREIFINNQKYEKNNH